MPPSVHGIDEYAISGRSLSSIIMGEVGVLYAKQAFNSATIYNTIGVPDYDYGRFWAEIIWRMWGPSTLYVQGEQTKEFLSSNPNCPLNIKTLIEPTELKIEGNNVLSGKPGDTFQLSAKLYPEDVTLPYVFWRSTNPDIAYVEHNGLVTIRADINDGNSCKIIAESLYRNGPIAEVTVCGEDAGIEDVVENASTEFDSNAPADVYTLTGVCVMRQATPADLTNLAPGLYIVGHRKIHIR